MKRFFGFKIQLIFFSSSPLPISVPVVSSHLSPVSIYRSPFARSPASNKRTHMLRSDALSVVRDYVFTKWKSQCEKMSFDLNENDMQRTVRTLRYIRGMCARTTGSEKRIKRARGREGERGGERWRWGGRRVSEGTNEKNCLDVRYCELLHAS